MDWIEKKLYFRIFRWIGLKKLYFRIFRWIGLKKTIFQDIPMDWIEKTTDFMDIFTLTCQVSQKMSN